MADFLETTLNHYRHMECGSSSISQKARSKLKDIELSEEAECLKRREINCCEECCRYKECHGKKLEIPDEAMNRLMGAIIEFAIHDLLLNIRAYRKRCPSLPRHKIELMKFYKGTAERFFNSYLFDLTGLNKEYLLEEGKKKINLESSYDLT